MAALLLSVERVELRFEAILAALGGGDVAAERGSGPQGVNQGRGTIKADRSRGFKSIFLSFWRGRNVAGLAHAAGILALAADAFRQDLGDGVQPLCRGQQVGVGEVIALGPLVEVDGHACVCARARLVRASDGGSRPPADGALNTIYANGAKGGK